MERAPTILGDYSIPRIPPPHSPCFKNSRRFTGYRYRQRKHRTIAPDKLRRSRVLSLPDFLTDDVTLSNTILQYCKYNLEFR